MYILKSIMLKIINMVPQGLFKRFLDPCSISLYNNDCGNYVKSYGDLFIIDRDDVNIQKSAMHNIFVRSLFST